MSSPRTYPANVISVHDGDSLTVALELWRWPTMTVRAELRLDGLNARELAMPGGPEACAHLIGLVPPGAPVMVTVHSVDKYGGRFDAGVVTAAGLDVGARMIADGYAAAWDGTGVKPVPAWPIPGSMP